MKKKNRAKRKRKARNPFSANKWAGFETESVKAANGKTVVQFKGWANRRALVK